MAPEQARSKAVDGRSDLFSLGVVLYRLCTGRLPFQGDTAIALLTALAVDMPPAVRELNPQVPPGLADLILRLLEKDPANRPQTAKEVVASLQVIDKQPSLAAVQATEPEKEIWQWAISEGATHPHIRSMRSARIFTRRIGLVIGAALAVVAIIVGAILMSGHGSGNGSDETRTATPQAEQSINVRHKEAATSHPLAGREQGTASATTPRAPSGEFKMLATLSGHELEVNGVAFSSDGKWLASAAGPYGRTGAGNGEVKVWHLTTGKHHRDLAGPAVRFVSVAFAAGTSILAAACENGTAYVWNAATGERLAELSGHVRGVHTVAFFPPDGRWLVTGDRDGAIRFWDVHTWKVINMKREHTGTVFSVAFSPNGRLLASGSMDNTIKIWDAFTGSVQVTLRGHGSAVHSVAFSPDGQTLASASWDHTVRLWDVSDEQLKAARPDRHIAERRRLTGHLLEVNAVVFVGDGNHVISGAGNWAAPDRGELIVWNAADGSEAQRLDGHAARVAGLAVAPDGTLATASWDKSIRLWKSARAASRIQPGWPIELAGR